MKFIYLSDKNKLSKLGGALALYVCQSLFGVAEY